MTAERVRFEALDENRPSQGVLGGILCSIGLAVLVVGATYLLENQLSAEKAATMLVQPLGLVWLILFGCVWVAWRRNAGILTPVLFLTWLLITFCGNGFVAMGLLSTLEGKYRRIEPLELDVKSLDVVVLLGGGTALGPGGWSQLGPSGDRVMMAARLYRAGTSPVTEEESLLTVSDAGSSAGSEDKLPTIVCTGESLYDAQSKSSPSSQAKELLLDMGVSEAAIVEIGGRNTSEELSLVKSWMLEQGSVGQLGIITSAWHMPRVEALAKAKSIDFEPIPCDFHSPAAWSIRSFIPSSDAMKDVSFVVKEYLGRLMRR